MASKAQQAERYIKFINQQLEILSGAKQSVIETLDHSINQVLGEVNAWLNGGNVNHTTYAVINNRIQQIINLFMAKSAEISDLETEDNKSDSDLLQTTGASSNNLTIPKFRYTRDQEQDKTIFCNVETEHAFGDPICADNTYITTTRFAKLEEAVLSLKKSTEEIEEKQENVNKRLEMLTNAKLISKNKNQERLTVLEKTGKEMSSNVDDLFETVNSFDVKLNKLEEENKTVRVSMNELNKQISSVRTCSNAALMTIQDLSMRVESKNQHYNEMSNKMNQLEISNNLMSSHYNEQFENMTSLNTENVENLIGMVCQLIAKRLTPLDKINETLNKKVISSKEYLSKVDSIYNELVEISGKVTDIESKFNHTTIGFYAVKIGHCPFGHKTINTFTEVSINYGRCFNQISGEFTVPLDGFYLIRIKLAGTKKSSSEICCSKKVKNPSYDRERFHQLCLVSDNEYLTCLDELKKRDILYLTSKTKVKEHGASIKIEFSCWIIK